MPKINLTDLNNLQNEVTATAAINYNNSVIEAAVENSISRDGTQPNHMNSVLDMNSNKIINLPDALSDQEPVTYGQYLAGVTAIGDGAVVDAPYVTLATNPTLLNERVLTPGAGLEMVDGGAGNSVVIGVASPELNALAGTGSSADKLPYYDGIGTAALADFTSFGRTLVANADATDTKTDLALVKADVGLDQVDNTSDADKPISTATQAALDDKVTGPASVVHERVAIFNGTSGKLIQDGGRVLPTGSIVGTSDTQTLTNKTINSSTINSPSGLVKSDVGLGNVDNTSDATKNAASVTLTNKTINGPDNTLTNIPVTSLSITGTPTGLKFLRDDASWQSIPGGGDLLSTNNLSDLTNSDTALTNLGGTTIGKALFTGTGYPIIKSQVFTASGTFTTPSNSSSSTVYKYRILGAGGGGGGTNGTAGAGGGGAGAYAEGTFTGVAASTNITITVGAAGTGGANTGGNGTSGGSSSIGSPVSITCGGGGGGIGVTSSVSLPGSGGVVTGTPNIASVSGYRGEPGVVTITGIVVRGGRGARTFLGHPGEPGMPNISASALSAYGYGAGGGGAVGNSGTGGGGAPGIVIIEWILQ